MPARNPKSQITFTRLKELSDHFAHRKRYLVSAEFEGRKPIYLVEKEQSTAHDFFCEHYSELAKKLRELKLNVVPTVRVIEEADGTKRIFYTDLTREGRFNLEEFVEKDEVTIDPKLFGLKNFDEIVEQISTETSIAKENGFSIEKRAWLIQVDPETNIGKPYIFDLKQVMKKF